MSFVLVLVLTTLCLGGASLGAWTARLCWDFASRAAQPPATPPATALHGRPAVLPRPLLYSQLLRRRHIRRAMSWVLSHRDSNASGPDGRTTHDLKSPQARQEEEDAIYQLLRRRQFAPSGVRSFFQWTGFKRRKLFTLNLRDAVIETAIRLLVEPAFDAGFEDGSWGFRPGRGVQRAAEAINRKVQEGFGAWARVDFRDFFASMDTGHLKVLLAQRIKDRRLLALLSTIIDHHTHSFWQGGTSAVASRGILLGSPISPLMANLYLHPSDEWLTRRGVVFFRYADDLLFLGRTSADVQAVWHDFDAFLKSSYPPGTELNPFKFAFGLATDDPRDWSWTFPPQMLGFSFAAGRDLAIGGGKVVEIVRQLIDRDFRWEGHLKGVFGYYLNMGSAVVAYQIEQLRDLLHSKAEEAVGTPPADTAQALTALSEAAKSDSRNRRRIARQLIHETTTLLVTDVSGWAEPAKQVWHPSFLLRGGQGSP